MQDRNAYHLHSQIRAARRQHYAQASATQKPRVPTWLKVAAIVACIGLAGGLTGCGGGGSAVELEPALAPSAPGNTAKQLKTGLKHGPIPLDSSAQWAQY